MPLLFKFVMEVVHPVLNQFCDLFGRDVAAKRQAARIDSAYFLCLRFNTRQPRNVLIYRKLACDHILLIFYPELKFWIEFICTIHFLIHEVIKTGDCDSYVFCIISRLKRSWLVWHFWWGCQLSHPNCSRFLRRGCLCLKHIIFKLCRMIKKGSMLRHCMGNVFVLSKRFKKIFFVPFFQFLLQRQAEEGHEEWFSKVLSFFPQIFQNGLILDLRKLSRYDLLQVPNFIIFSSFSNILSFSLDKVTLLKYHRSRHTWYNITLYNTALYNTVLIK